MKIFSKPDIQARWLEGTEALEHAHFGLSVSVGLASGVGMIEARNTLLSARKANYGASSTIQLRSAGDHLFVSTTLAPIGLSWAVLWTSSMIVAATHLAKFRSQTLLSSSTVWQNRHGTLIGNSDEVVITFNAKIKRNYCRSTRPD